MRYLGMYAIYRIIRGSRSDSPGPTRPSGVFELLVAGIVMSLLWGTFILLFAIAGPMWMVLPFAFAEIVVIVLIAHAISELHDGQQGKN